MSVDLYRELMLRFPGFSDPRGAARAFAEDLDGIPEPLARRAAFGLLAERPDRLPNGPSVRRRVLEDAGLLAPCWSEALALAADVHHGRRRPSEVPGPVSVIDSDALHATYTKSWEEAYEAEAKAHDRRILAPGGIAELQAAAEWLAAARERRERLCLAQQCAADLLDPPALLPGPNTPDETLAEYIDRWQAEHDAVPQLAPVLVNPDEHWEAAPAVVSRINDLRRLAGTRRNGAA